MQKSVPRTGHTTSIPVRRPVARGSWLPAGQVAALVVALVFFLALAPIVMYQIVYADRVFLGVTSLGIDLGGYSEKEAKSALGSQFGGYAQTEIVLVYGEKTWRTTPGALGIRLDSEMTVKQALQVGRQDGIFDRLGTQLSSVRRGRTVAPVIVFERERQSTVLGGIAREIDQPVINASLIVRPEGAVELVSSQIGRKVNVDETIRRIEASLGTMGTQPVEVQVAETPPRVREADLVAARESAEAILSGPLTITYQDQSVTLDPVQLTALLLFRQEGDKSVAELDAKGIAEVVTKMAETIDRKPKDARFSFRDGRLQVVAESVDGLTVDVAASVQSIRARALERGNRNVPLIVHVAPPHVTSADAERIYLKDKLAEASTPYGDTGLDRQHNVVLATQRLNGIVIAPGETFSFNKALGPTRLVDGYKMAWGIISTGSGHETVPSEAGGICQVATTLFHAALWTGLQIDQRLEHVYWIPRYGKPPLGKVGLDATVDGSGSDKTVDFKFTNNTSNWLAIEARTDGRNVYFAVYGVKPDWTVEVREPKIFNVVKADTTVVRQPDPQLKPGQEVWIELANDGFDVEVLRVVRQGDRVIDQYVVKSHYRPARNVVRYGPDPTPTPTPSPAEGDEADAPAPVATPEPTASAVP